MPPIPRRRFLKDSAQAVATSAAGLTIVSRSASATAASERINLAVMGIRGRGRGLAMSFAGMEGARVACLCDVDSRLLPPLAGAIAERQQGSEPRTEKDVRRVLEDRSIDALVIATPDHWHAPATIWACQAGKHVYVEKPASHNIWEGRQMVEAARKYDRVVQLGTQSRSAPHYIDMIAAIRAGRIGPVHM